MDVETRRGELEWMRGVLRESIAEAPAYSRAALVRELRAVTSELASLPEPEVNPLDDIAAQRARRRSGSKVSRPA